MDIRKISIGTDYKNNSMHYIVGQKVLGDSHEIHLIKYKISINKHCNRFIYLNIDLPGRQNFS